MRYNGSMKVHNQNNLPTIPIADLLPTQGELKDLSEKNYNKLKANIERRGFIDPVSVWEDDKGLKHLLNGHQRQRVLTKEGWDEPIPYFNIPAENLQEAAAIVLELTSQYGTITQEGLDAHIAKYELPEAEIYEATHYDALMFGQEAEPETEVEEDEAPEVSSEPPVSKLGEVYQLGRHRLMCGDSSDFTLISELINGTEIDTILTDPPYGIGIDGQKESKNNTNPKHNRKAHEYRDWDSERPSSEHFDVILSFKANTIIWGGNYFADLLTPSRGWIYWDKGQNGLTMSDGELAWTNLDKPLRAVVSNRANIGDSVHPTQKPINVMTFCLNHTNADNVLDLFGGSGSTLIAAEQTSRTCFMMELSESYCDVIRKRYAKFTNNNELPENWEELTPAINNEDIT